MKRDSSSDSCSYFMAIKQPLSLHVSVVGENKGNITSIFVYHVAKDESIKLNVKIFLKTISCITSEFN